MHLGPWRSGKQLLVDLGRKVPLILRRGRPISNIFAANAHANILKRVCSTDSKSNCISIGLRKINKRGRCKIICTKSGHLIIIPTPEDGVYKILKYRTVLFWARVYVRVPVCYLLLQSCVGRSYSVRFLRHSPRHVREDNRVP